MTMRLDLRTRHLNRVGMSNYPPPGIDVVLVNPTPFGCADCEQWFQFAWQLLAHDCEARDAR